MTPTPPFTNAELAEMALDHLLNMADKLPDPMDRAWASLDKWLGEAQLDAVNEVKRQFGETDQAAAQTMARIALLTKRADAAKLTGMVAVAGVILGQLQPGGREAVRKLIRETA